MVPRISLFVAACALTFQTTVLLPWHNTISNDVIELRKSIENLTKIVEQKKVDVPKKSVGQYGKYPMFFNQPKYMNFPRLEKQ
jgi:hypothetical protein